MNRTLETNAEEDRKAQCGNPRRKLSDPSAFKIKDVSDKEGGGQHQCALNRVPRSGGEVKGYAGCDQQSRPSEDGLSIKAHQGRYREECIEELLPAQRPDRSIGTFGNET